MEIKINPKARPDYVGYHKVGKIYYDDDADAYSFIVDTGEGIANVDMKTGLPFRTYSTMEELNEANQTDYEVTGHFVVESY